MLDIKILTVAGYEENTVRDIISINGIIDEDSEVQGSKGRLLVDIFNDEIIDLLKTKSFLFLKKYFDRISFLSPLDYWDNPAVVTLYPRKRKKDSAEENSIRMSLHINFQEWTRPYPMIQLADLMEENVITLDNKLVRFQTEGDYVSDGFGIFHQFKKDDIVGDCTEIVLDVIDELHERTSTHLLMEIEQQSGNVNITFEFPEHLKTSAKQYLIYFAQFLEDLGIEAETELKEQSLKTLFTVIPKDKNESLSKIKEALDLYISAPASNEAVVVGDSMQDIAVLQWQAQMMHLRSQLMFAQSTLQMKDATITSLQLSNYQLTEIVSKHEKDKGEAVAGGLATLKKYDGKWFAVDLPEIFRRMKRKFSRANSDNLPQQ